MLARIGDFGECFDRCGARLARLAGGARIERHPSIAVAILDPRMIGGFLGQHRLSHGRVLTQSHAVATQRAHQVGLRAAPPCFDARHEIAAFNHGVALEDLGRVRDAIAAYERAIELDADNADAHFNLAGLYEKRGEKAAALRHLSAYRQLTVNG